MSSLLKSLVPCASLVVCSVVGCGGERARPQAPQKRAKSSQERTKPPPGLSKPPPGLSKPPPRRTNPPPRRISWGFGEPCIRWVGGKGARPSGGKASLRAQHVVQVDRRSPHWLVRASKHMAQSGGCVGCARIGNTWKPRTVGFHAHLRSNGVLLIEGQPATLGALPKAVQSCFNMLDSAGMHVLLTTAPGQRKSARLTAILKRLLIPGVSVHLYSNRP